MRERNFLFFSIDISKKLDLKILGCLGKQNLFSLLPSIGLKRKGLTFLPSLPPMKV
jgi:hypothetical protein